MAVLRFHVPESRGIELQGFCWGKRTFPWDTVGFYAQNDRLSPWDRPAPSWFAGETVAPYYWKPLIQSPAYQGIGGFPQGYK